MLTYPNLEDVLIYSDLEDMLIYFDLEDVLIYSSQEDMLTYSDLEDMLFHLKSKVCYNIIFDICNHMLPQLESSPFFFFSGMEDSLSESIIFWLLNIQYSFCVLYSLPPVVVISGLYEKFNGKEPV